jgi:hypothetical protein
VPHAGQAEAKMRKREKQIVWDVLDLFRRRCKAFLNLFIFSVSDFASELELSLG